MEDGGREGRIGGLGEGLNYTAGAALPSAISG